MARIRVRTTIDAPPRAVWRAIEDISTHVEWMADARAIRFLTPQRRGVGTAFECDTAVGPFTLTDVMEITRWDRGKAMGVRHVGVVTGEGTFRLRSRRGGRTKFVWRERLRFPWWLGGPVGAWFGAIVLDLVWRGNLRRLKRYVEAGAGR